MYWINIWRNKNKHAPAIDQTRYWHEYNEVYYGYLDSNADIQTNGLLTPESVKWGDFKGIYKGTSRRGISHCDEVDMRRRAFSKKKGNGVSDILEVYEEIYATLSELNF